MTGLHAAEWIYCTGTRVAYLLPLHVIIKLSSLTCHNYYTTTTKISTQLLQLTTRVSLEFVVCLFFAKTEDEGDRSRG